MTSFIIQFTVVEAAVATVPEGADGAARNRRPIAPAIRLACVVLMASALGACSLAPHLVRPDAPVAPAYPGAAGTGAQDGKNTPAAATPDWQTFFTDPQLRTLIQTALDNNRDLRIAALRIEEARAQYNIQRADLLPNFGLSASAARARTSASAPGATSTAAANPSSTTASTTTSSTTTSTNASASSVATGAALGGGGVGTTYQVGANLTAFELDFFGRVRSLNDAALAQYFATEEAQRAARISLIAQVANAYLAERAYAEQLQITQQTVEGREVGYQLAKKRFDVGASSALDLRLNETLVQSARVSLVTLARQRAQAVNALTLLTGAPTTALNNDISLSAQKIVTDIPAGLPSELLTRRPDIRAAEQRLVSANANIGAARAAFFPRISLTAGIGTASRSLSGLFESGSGTWSFVPQLVLPIFDAGRNSANLDLANVRKNIAIADYERTIQSAFREVADALVARDWIDQQVQAQQAVLDAQAERYRLAQLRFTNGVASSLDVLDAQRELFTAQQQLVQARQLRLTNAIDLYRALGGGIDAADRQGSQSIAPQG